MEDKYAEIRKKEIERQKQIADLLGEEYGGISVIHYAVKPKPFNESGICRQYLEFMGLRDDAEKIKHISPIYSPYIRDREQDKKLQEIVMGEDLFSGYSKEQRIAILKRASENYSCQREKYEESGFDRSLKPDLLYLCFGSRVVSALGLYKIALEGYNLSLDDKKLDEYFGAATDMCKGIDGASRIDRRLEERAQELIRKSRSERGSQLDVENDGRKIVKEIAEYAIPLCKDILKALADKVKDLYEAD